MQKENLIREILKTNPNFVVRAGFKGMNLTKPCYHFNFHKILPFDVFTWDTIKYHYSKGGITKVLKRLPFMIFDNKFSITWNVKELRSRHIGQLHEILEKMILTEEAIQYDLSDASMSKLAMKAYIATSPLLNTVKA